MEEELKIYRDNRITDLLLDQIQSLLIRDLNLRGRKIRHVGPSIISNLNVRTLVLLTGDGVNVISTGIKAFISIPFDCIINEVNMLADQSGSIVVDIWKDTYAHYPPTIADTIVASAKPTITTAVKSNNKVLTGWTRNISANDTLHFNVDSCTSITKLTLQLTLLTL